MAPEKLHWDTAFYERLSREDGDRPESDSILNQQRLLEDYCSHHPEFRVADHYSDDGFTGTNFNRPAFKRMLRDIDSGRINCVIVKDLSRFGRDYIDTGYYLERYLPERGVRFIAVNDGVDSQRGTYDMMLPLKNVFNTQYARDISEKVRSAFKVKQRRGEFVGAFASYGYRKDPDRRSHLIVDPAASAIVRRIFEMAASGTGQARIALILNGENIPCPSEYKRLMGDKYSNSRKLDSTHYWTYSTVHKLLHNEIYLGNMVQGRTVRSAMHGKARQAAPSDWIVKEGTHAPIISRELWDTVQAQLSKHSRTPDFEQNVGLFAGLLKCADCGRAMVKTRWNNVIRYSCGSYRRYGSSICTKHYITQQDIEAVILRDLNRIIGSVRDLNTLVREARLSDTQAEDPAQERERLEAALNRLRRFKQGCYEDYQDKLLSREEFLRYKADYDAQEQRLVQQLESAKRKEDTPPEQPWTEELLRLGGLAQLDRATVAQTVKEIRVFEDQKFEITYLFSDTLHPLLEPQLPCTR